MIFLLLACAGEKGDADNSACQDLMGSQEEGATWEYTATDDAGGSGTLKIKLVTVADGEFTYTLDEDMVSTTAGHTELTQTFVHSCDETGLYRISLEFSSTTTVGDEVFTNSGTNVYSPPALRYPTRLEVGSHWETVVSGTTTTATEESLFSYTVRGEVTGSESLETGAGTFDCVRITQTTTVGDQTAVNDSCLSFGKGEVEIDDFIVDLYKP